MIEFGGLSFPLETFLDAFRYVRTGGAIPDFAGLAGTLDIVQMDGTRRSGIAMADVPWHDTIAVLPREDCQTIGFCPNCESQIVAVVVLPRYDSKGASCGQIVETDWCLPCQLDAEQECG